MLLTVESFTIEHVCLLFFIASTHPLSWFIFVLLEYFYCTEGLGSNILLAVAVVLLIALVQNVMGTLSRSIARANDVVFLDPIKWAEVIDNLSLLRLLFACSSHYVDARRFNV